MPLLPETRIGSYEIAAAIGAGGMGEVYRARDTKLGRDVALKILPDGFARDPDRLARFKREAQLLASLNHPNIAVIYGIEDTTDTTGLVLELVEGPTLADRVASGPVAVDEALAIVAQIVEGLNAAHAQGVVHRDLKPANIKLRPDGSVKILDFGLAKLVDQPGAPDTHPTSAQPTMTSPALTELGVILGTAAYMAPEQARGRPLDKRADIWAFGCVLYEMLTGQRAFPGDDISEAIANILKSEPAWSALPADTPSSIVRLLRRCLMKDPAKRLPDIGVARLDIADAMVPSSHGDQPATSPARAARSRAYERVALALISVALLAAAPFAIRHLRESPPANAPTIRMTIAAPGGTRFAALAGGAISPDGRLVVFRASNPGEPVRLWLRPLDALDARELGGTDGATGAFWSPDSRSIGFHTGGTVKTLNVTDGRVHMVAAVPSFSGGAWGADGTIIYGSAGNTGLWRVPATGGAPVGLTSLDAAADERGHIVPQFLPDGRRFLFTVVPGNHVFLASIDSAARTRVLENASNAAYAPPGYLLFARQGTLLAQRFDAERALVTGDPLPVASGVVSSGGGAWTRFSVSAAGMLLYEMGPTVSGGIPVWVDPQGRETPVPDLHLPDMRHPRLSPDGQRLALVSAGDIWVHDLTGKPAIRLTFDAAQSPALSPLWTPDGRSLVFERGVPNEGLWSIPSDGSTDVSTRVSASDHLHPHGWTTGGREIVAARLIAGDTADIVAVPFLTPGESRAIVSTPAIEGREGVAMSPDGRSMAYAADPTGLLEIWVRPSPGPGAPVRVSPDGGYEPTWSRDGRTLFYRETDRVLSVSVQPGEDFRFTPPTTLFESSYQRGQPPSYDVARDGRLLMLAWPPGSEPGAQPLIVVSNWIAEVERLRQR